MRTRMLRWLAPAVLVLGIPAVGYATSITITGGTAGTIPAGSGLNNFVGPLFAGPSIGGFYGAQLDFSAPPGSQLRLDFFGAEADFNNEFNLGAAQLFAHTPGTLISLNLASPLGTFSTTLAGLGLLAFHFDVHSDTGSVFDGSNLDNSAHNLQVPNFFLTCNPFSSLAGAGGRNCDQVYAFLDDGGGQPFDPDYDDMLVRVTITAVPEPATLLMLGLGLGGSFLARRIKH
jgi:PEP-CTERM motif